ncbi:DNA/RNA polymerase [Hysterangium stoloniferum]|nr:DNA/RNA polymerase [Hysterangium stoloniferum]
MPASPWKGKSREDSDVEDLNPVITYRHLLSSGLGVRNPLRVCALTDMDAFYAACEQQRLKLNPEVPLVVRQWDALIAVNYPARKYGITRMEKITAAVEKCPHLRVVHVATFDPSTPDAKPIYTDNPDSETHKVSLDHYRKESKKIMDLFKELLPGAEVERASIDEAFIDLTELVRQRILAHFPELATPPSEGFDSPLPPPPPMGIPLSYPPSRLDGNNHDGSLWSGLGMLIPLSGKPSPPSQPKKETASSTTIENAPDESNTAYQAAGSPDDEAFSSPDMTAEEDGTPTWHDIALSIAASLLLKMREEVKSRLGYTTSAGIARNKFLAKLVASYKKRDSQSILRNAAIPNYLRPLPFQKIRFLGGKLGSAIAATYGAQTVGDLLDISLEEMQSKLGENSIWVWEILRGIDRSEVKEKPPVPKSMGAAKNLQHPITHPSQGAHWLRILAGELAFRLQEAREEAPGLWPKTLVLHIRLSYNYTKSKQAPFPFSRSPGIDYICKAANKLWVELVGTGAEYDKNKANGRVAAMKVTHVFLGFSGVATMAAGQRNIDAFFLGGTGLGKRKAVEDDFSESVGADKKQRDTDDDRPALEDNDEGSEPNLGVDVSFRCTRCGETFRRTVDDDDPEYRKAVLETLKMEHDDFHFAQDLAKEGGISTRPPQGNIKKKKKKKPEVKGIAKYFSPQSSSSRQR